MAVTVRMPGRITLVCGHCGARWSAEVPQDTSRTVSLDCPGCRRSTATLYGDASIRSAPRDDR